MACAHCLCSAFSRISFLFFIFAFLGEEAQLLLNTHTHMPFCWIIIRYSIRRLDMNAICARHRRNEKKKKWTKSSSVIIGSCPMSIGYRPLEKSKLKKDTCTRHSAAHCQHRISCKNSFGVDYMTHIHGLPPSTSPSLFYVRTFFSSLFTPSTIFTFKQKCLCCCRHRRWQRVRVQHIGRNWEKERANERVKEYERVAKTFTEHFH